MCKLPFKVDLSHLVVVSTVTLDDGWPRPLLPRGDAAIAAPGVWGPARGWQGKPVLNGELTRAMEREIAGAAAPVGLVDGVTGNRGGARGFVNFRTDDHGRWGSGSVVRRTRADHGEAGPSFGYRGFVRVVTVPRWCVVPRG